MSATLPYDPEVARAKLAEYQADLNEATLIADAFAEEAEAKRDTVYRLERQIHTLTERMRADGLLPPEEHEVDVGPGAVANCRTCGAWVGRISCRTDEDAAAWAETHRRRMAGRQVAK